jgi:L-2-hydroxyglutarate oxidase LhgO
VNIHNILQKRNGTPRESSPSAPVCRWKRLNENTIFFTMTTDYDFAVIGSGVVGLAIAAELASRGSLLAIEKESKFGQASSSHNSEVVHAGLYYTPGSLKARLCVEGNHLIRELAARHGIGYRQVGKLVVAADDEERRYLEWLKGNAAANGVTDLHPVSPEELRRQEPAVRGVAALFSPTSGIVDSHGLMVHFKTRAERRGADFVFNAEVVAIQRIEDGYDLTIKDADGALTTISAERVINSAGLYSDRIAAMAGLNVEALELDLLWAHGHYYTAEGSGSFHITHLVYPVPDPSLKSLGVHATVDLQGGVRFGPTSEYMNEKVEDYSYADAETVRVSESIARYLPDIASHKLEPMMTGIRPKLTRPGEAPRDFYIREERDRGLPGFVNLIGIESPGLTAAPAIAKYVATLI